MMRVWHGWVLGLTLLLLGCERGPTAHDRALGEAALGEARALIAAHPQRVAGQQSREAAGWIAGRLPEQGTQLLPFTAAPGMLMNVLHMAHPRPVAILASHFDTKADIPDFVGANDGASTTGLLIALAREGALPVHYLFLDGEECRERYTAEDGLHGSWFVARGGAGLSKHLPVIVLDMLGDADFEPALASNGSPALNAVIRRAGAAVGMRLGNAGEMVDDHVPFRIEGWRAANVIDFEYGPYHTWWHTSEDTLDKLSAESLAKTVALVRKTVELLDKEQR